jgi:hypothetical protein
MVRWTRQVTGTFHFDFTVFDRYVETALEEGITGQIHAYSTRQFMCPDGVTIGFYNQEDDQYQEEYVVIGTEKYRRYWGTFLTAFNNHLIEKGWLEKTYLGIDEPESEKPFHTMLAFIKEIAPMLKVTSALNRVELARSFPENLKNISFGLGQIEPAFIQKFKEAHLETTYYVCCIPAEPNTFLTSTPLEARILPWLAWQQKLDGFLRWSYAFWPSVSDGSYDPFNYLRWDFPRDWKPWPWPSGDMFLVYPGPDGYPVSSIRWEMLRLGIQDYEYLVLLKDRLTEVEPAQATKIEESVGPALELVVKDFHNYTSSMDDIENVRIIISNILSNKSTA